jgi:hypothetical protein
MPALKDLAGQTFTRLTVVSRAENDRHGKVMWRCLCECGQSVVVNGSSLIRGLTQSCNCLKRELSSTRFKKCRPSGRLYHGHARVGQKTKTYRSWEAMRYRCCNPNATYYSRYGGNGVRVCDRWNPESGGSFENFLADMDERPEGTTLGRILDLGNYELGNAFWHHREEQELARKNNRALLKWAAAREVPAMSVAA